jgi:hypothetical protein
MIDAVLDVGGFIRHIKITIEMLREGRLNVPVPRILADLLYGEPPDTASMKVIQFYLRRYDEKNHIAYYDYCKWV